MNEEERQHAMDFILDQQAKNSTDIERLATTVGKLTGGFEKLTAGFEKSEYRIARLERVLKLAIRAGLRERHDFRVRSSALLDAQIRTEDAMSELREANRRNSEDINALTKLVARIATRHNGEADAE